MGRRVNVIGVGMVKFAKPGASEEYNVMASKAARGALADAGVPYGEVEQAYAGYVYGDSTCGQRAVYVVDGAVEADGESYGAGQMIVFEPGAQASLP